MKKKMATRVTKTFLESAEILTLAKKGVEVSELTSPEYKRQINEKN